MPFLPPSDGIVTPTPVPPWAPSAPTPFSQPTGGDTEIELSNEPIPPTKKHIDEAGSYIKSWCRRSAQYVQTKTKRLELLEDLYWNRRLLKDWDVKNEEALGETSRGVSNDNDEEPISWRAQGTMAVSPFVDAYVSRMVTSVFQSEDYFIVEPRPSMKMDSIEDPRFPTSKKIQAKLIDTANELQFRTRVYEAIADSAIFGTAVSKVLWLEDRGLPIPAFDPISGLMRLKPNILRHGPSLENINLLRFLPDPLARSGDVSKWSGVGDRSYIPYQTIKSRFDSGLYDINKKEFFAEWDKGEKLGAGSYDEIKDDEDAYQDESPDTYLQGWEWHGKIHFSDKEGPTECVATLISGVDDDDPTEGGMLVRLREAPALYPLGRRPYIVYQFTPTASPLGQGIVEPNLDLVWTISHLQNLFTDAVRLMAVPMGKAHYLSPMWDDMETDEDGSMVFPGRWFRYRDNPEEIQPFTFQGADLNSLSNLIQYLEKNLEKRTAVSDVTRAVPSGRKTATEFHGLMEQHKQPIKVRLDLFRENFLEPFAKIALAYFAKRITEDQVVWGKGENNTPTPVVLTPQELRTGEYIVRAAIDTERDAKIAKAQTIQQVLPILEQLAFPLIAYENVKYSRKKLIDELIKLLDINDPDSVLEEVDEAEKIRTIMLMQNGGLPPMPPQMGGMGQQMEGGFTGGPMGVNPSNANTAMAERQQVGQTLMPGQNGRGPGL